MSDTCAITGVDKVINYTDGVAVSTRGSKFIPLLQDRYLDRVKTRLTNSQIERLLADREAKIVGNENLAEDQTPVEVMSEDEIRTRVSMYVTAMTRKPSRKDIITLIKFKNDDIIKLIEELRAEVNS
jgi:hypothetical protein